ncbi:CBS domain-containing protein [Flavitalea antarctica]
MEIVKAIAEKKYGLLVRDLMKENLTVFSGDDLIETGLEELAVNPERVFPVLSNGHSTGVINLNYLIEYLLIHKADSKEFARIKSLAGLI